MASLVATGDGARTMRTVRRQSELGEWELVLADPDPRLAGHVTSVQAYAEHLDGPVRWWELPGTKMPLIIDLGSGFRLLDPCDTSVAVEHGSFFAGFHARPAVPESDGRARCIQVNFTPIGAHLFLGVPMSELANLIVDPADVLGAAASRLVDRLHDSATWEARFRTVEDFIAGRMLRTKPPSPGVAWAWSRLDETGGQVDIGALATELGWSHKRLIARFREQVGVPPKLVARVLRFDRAVRLIDRGTELTWTELALACGYYDQAHLIRDFRELSGMTPTELVRQRTGVNSVQDAELAVA